MTRLLPRLDIEGLTIGDLTWQFTPVHLIIYQVSTNADRIHESYHFTAIALVRGSIEMSIGYEIIRVDSPESLAAFVILPVIFPITLFARVAQQVKGIRFKI